MVCLRFFLLNMVLRSSREGNPNPYMWVTTHVASIWKVGREFELPYCYLPGYLKRYASLVSEFLNSPFKEHHDAVTHIVRDIKQALSFVWSQRIYSSCGVFQWRLGGLPHQWKIHLWFLHICQSWPCFFGKKGAKSCSQSSVKAEYWAMDVAVMFIRPK